MALDEPSSVDIARRQLEIAEMSDVLIDYNILQAFSVVDVARNEVLLLVENNGKKALMLFDLKPNSFGVSVIRDDQLSSEVIESVFEAPNPIEAFSGLRARVSRVLAEDKPEGEDEAPTLH